MVEIQYTFMEKSDYFCLIHSWNVNDLRQWKRSLLLFVCDRHSTYIPFPQQGSWRHLWVSQQTKHSSCNVFVAWFFLSWPIFLFSFWIFGWFLILRYSRVIHEYTRVIHEYMYFEMVYTTNMSIMIAITFDVAWNIFIVVMLLYRIPIIFLDRSSQVDLTGKLKLSASLETIDSITSLSNDFRKNPWNHSLILILY